MLENIPAGGPSVIDVVAWRLSMLPVHGGVNAEREAVDGEAAKSWRRIISYL